MNDLKEYTMNETKTYKKKLLFHLVFSAFYIILFLYMLDTTEQNTMKTPTIVISPIFIFIHVMLTKKYIWLLEVFGFDGDEDETDLFD